MNRPVLQEGEFWVKEVYCNAELSLEDLIDPKPRNSKDVYLGIVLKGDWRPTGGVDVEHGSVSITLYEWKDYVSHCKKNDMASTPTGALEYSKEKGNRDSRDYHYF
jgi:hypothetical protein